MTTIDITSKIANLQELRRMQEELTAEIEAAQDEIKAIMGTEEVLLSGPYKVTWKPVTTTRLDTAALKKDLPDVAARYSKTTTTRRFTVN